jgi:hypothetical protein
LLFANDLVMMAWCASAFLSLVAVQHGGVSVGVRVVDGLRLLHVENMTEAGVRGNNKEKQGYQGRMASVV